MSFSVRTGHKLNIRHESLLILRTVDSMDNACGVNLIVQILRGTEGPWIKKGTHTSLITFGALHHTHQDRIRNLVHFLLNNAYLQVAHAAFGSLALTAKGTDFLKHPADLIVKAHELRTSRYDKMLLAELRQLRLQLCTQEDKPPFRIFTDYSLQRLVQDKPMSMAQLKEIPGFGDFKAERYGAVILRAILRMMEKKRLADQTYQQQKAQSPSHQEVKALFEAGMGVEEMAEKRAVQPNTIIRSLITLQEAGQIQLEPWIRHHVPPHTLQKIVAYFDQKPESSLKEAQKALQIDYDTLHLGKIFRSLISIHTVDVPQRL